jgi:hypothetical protein
MRQGWLKEALFAGQTANGFKIGTVMSLGWFWIRTSGCRLVYRGESMETIDFDNVLAVTSPETDEVTLPDFISYEAGKDYFYIVRCASRCGQIERTLKAAVKVSIDSEGKLEAGKPNVVFGLAVKRRRDGQIELVWGYYPIEQESEPEEMRIYTDAGTGEVNEQELIAVVQYKGKRFYQYKSEIPVNRRYRYAVRTADSDGNEQRSSKFVEIETSGRSVEAIEIVGVISE